MTDIDCNYELISCSDFIILPGFIDFVAQDVVSTVHGMYLPGNLVYSMLPSVQNIIFLVSVSKNVLLMFI